MPTILVVDDEAEIVRILEKFLSRHGFSVLTAAGGKEAGEILRAQPPDLLLIDIRMPGMDGISVLRRARQSGQKIPAIILGGSILDEAEIQDLKNIGFGEADIFYKPLDLNVLLEAVNGKLSPPRR